MLHKTMILIPVALFGTLPFAASAETMSAAEIEMFNSATLTLQQAGDTALQTHPGKLASVDFGADDSRAGYYVAVVGNDGQPWTVMIDAQTGEVYASGLSSAMEDGADVQHDDSDGSSEDEESDDEGSDDEGSET